MNGPVRRGLRRGRVRVGLAVALVAATTFGAAACGITSDESPRRIPDNVVPEVLRGTPDTAVTAPETTTPTP